MGLLLVLRSPQPHPKSLRRATRAQRRQGHQADAAERTTAAERGLLLDVSVEELLALVNESGGNRLPILGQLDPWSDGVLSLHDLPQLHGEIDHLEAVASDDVKRELVAALRMLLARWRDEPDLVLHWYGD